VPGATLRVYADLLPASDGTAPFSIHTFNQITGGDTIRPRQIAVANDHFVFNHREADDKQTAIGKQFADLHGHQRVRYYATPGDGIFHFYFPEQGLVVPGASFRRGLAQPRVRCVRRARLRRRLHHAGLRWATGYVYFTVAGQRRVVSKDGCSPWVSGKDVVLALLARWGAKQRRA
jgi:homoaconitase/3-isopropylmalate dehydratase large subunit